jgi:heat shock protein HslJ
MSYKDQMVYHDKDVKPTITEGAWELKDNILTLSASGGGKMKFSVTSGKLTLLDGEGNPVPNSDIIKLTRQLADDSGMLDRWYEKRNRGIDFIAGGNEPFWSVEIDIEKRTLSFNKIDFKAPLEFKDFDLTALADPNTKTFYGNTAEHNITVEITKTECTDNMSGDVSPYKVIVSLRTGKSNKTDIYFGCGRFLADKQLTASWLIESIKGKNIKDYNLTTGKVPVLELNAASERFSGTAGCNNYFGSFAAESNKIIFGKVASTLMLCADMSMEKDVFTLLNENEYLWSIGNNMLILTDLSGNKVMELRKGQ